MFLKKLRAVGFEPTPLSRLAPEASALDHSAKLPKSKSCKESSLVYDLSYSLSQVQVLYLKVHGCTQCREASQVLTKFFILTIIFTVHIEATWYSYS